MGNFYVNHTLKTSAQDEVMRALAGRTAIVTPPRDGYIVVYDRESDEQDGEQIEARGAHLSEQLHCPVLAVLNHDDDVFWYTLFQDGIEIDSYDSSPGYFDSEELSPPAGGDAQKLCDAFGSSAVTDVHRILHKSWEDEDAYVFQCERHLDLVTALGLPEAAVGAGFESVSGGDIPEGFTAQDLVRLP